MTLGDERWVPTDHPQSNERLVRETLIEKTDATFIGLKTDASSPEAAIDQCRVRLEEIPRPFDVVFAGMGEDGHTASLFPEQAVSGGDFQPAVRPDFPRLSMTPNCLLNSRHIVMAINGTSKKETFGKALRPGPASTFPIRHLLHQEEVPVSVVLD